MSPPYSTTFYLISSCHLLRALGTLALLAVTSSASILTSLITFDMLLSATSRIGEDLSEVRTTLCRKLLHLSFVRSERFLTEAFRPYDRSSNMFHKTRCFSRSLFLLLSPSSYSHSLLLSFTLALKVALTHLVISTLEPKRYSR